MIWGIQTFVPNVFKTSVTPLHIKCCSTVLEKATVSSNNNLSDLRQPGSEDIRFGRSETFPMCVVAFIVQTAALSQLVHMRPGTLHISLLWFCIRQTVAPYLSKVNKLKLSLCLISYALRHEDVCESGCIDPRILDRSTTLWWIVSFTPRQIYSLDRKMGGPHSWSRRRERETNLAFPGTSTLTSR
jgi:hypothetical protein